jgi:hypothetical protein
MPGCKVTPKMLADTRDYIKNYRKVYKDQVPSWAGLIDQMGIPKFVLNNCRQYPPKPGDKSANAKRKREMSVLLDSLLSKQERALVNGGLNGDMNSNIAKMMLHGHGHSDKLDTTLSGPDGGPIETDTTWTIEFVGTD